MMALLKKNFLQIIIVGLLASCGTSKKASAPAAVDQLPPLQESTINIPVKVNALPFVQEAEAKTPLQFTSAAWPDYVASGCDFRYKYRFVRSGFRISCVNNKATITMVGNYQIAGSKSVCAFGKQVSPWVSGSCGFSPEAMRRVEINIGSLFSFQPNYTVKSKSAVERITPLDKCTVTLLSTDVTDLVIDSIRSSVNAVASSLDEMLAGISLSEIISKTGQTAGKKIPLGDYGFIKINPSAVRISPVNFIKDTLSLIAGFACFPEISSDSINHVVTSFLPPLSSASLQEGFQINTNASYEYRFIDSLLTRYVKNNPFVIEGRTINIQKIAVRGLDNNMVEIRFDFTGSKSGTVYLRGTPVLDPQAQVISIPDLDYSLRSRDFVLTLGKTFFNSKIIRTIREKAVVHIRDIYLENKPKIDSALNRPINATTYTSGFTRDIRLNALVIKKDNLLFQVSTSGKLQVVVKGK